MPRKKYEECPNCGDKKVAENVEQDVRMYLHNKHVIHAPYDEYRVFVCESCGWFASMRWHPENYEPLLFRELHGVMNPPEPEPEPFLDDIEFDE
jgi:predicted nucleic-acid-binding Zn-ribbon protein